MKTEFFLLLTCLLPAVASATDFTRFLADPTLEIVKENGQPKLFPGGPDEKYYAKDAHGNLYKVRMKNAVPTYAEIGVSMVTEAMGLPNSPVYPILMRRGTQGVPTADEAKALAPGNSAAGLAGARGEWFPASAQPMIEIAGSYDVAKLTGKQRAELVSQLAVNAVFGNNDFSTGDNLAFTGKHFTTLDATQSFKFFTNETPDQPTLVRTLAHMPEGITKGLSPADIQVMMEEVNRYLSRLEKIPAADLERIFMPYYRGTNSFRKFKEMGEFDFQKALLARIQAARSAVTATLEMKGAKAADLASLKTALAVPAPHITLPTIADAAGINLLDHPMDALWSEYFQDFWKARSGAEEQWGKAMGTTSQNSITELATRASQGQKKIPFVATHMDPNLQELTYSDDLDQLHLNTHNNKTLVVVPINDMEASAIRHVAERSGAQVMALNVPHGSKLDEETVKKINDAMHAQKLTRLVISELPSIDGKLEEQFKKDYDFKVVDHHAYAGMADRRKPISSLEQTAQILGYKLSPTEKAIAVNDHSFLYGLRDMGVPKATVEKLYPPKISAEELAKIPSFASKYGKIYIATNAGKIGDVAGALVLKEWPHPVNLLMVGGDIRFSGDPRLRKILDAQFEPYKAEVEALYHGGDPVRSEFWGVKGIPEKDHPVYIARALGTVQAELEEADAKTFRARLEHELKIPPKYLDMETATKFASGELKDEPITRAQIEAINQIVDPKERVEKLASVRTKRLAPDALDLLMEHSRGLSNSFEIGQYLRLAHESGDARWEPVVDDWIKSWETANPKQQWQTILLGQAHTVKQKLKLDNGTPLSLGELKAINDVVDPKERVGKLGALEAKHLSPEAMDFLLEHSKSLSNSFEIAQYARIGVESGDARWLPLMDHWLQTWDTAVPRQRWMEIMTSQVQTAKQKLTDHLKAAPCAANYEKLAAGEK